jgi:hypothetical protein
VKIARTIGLAVLAAMALMAFAGAGSASAAKTTFCKTGVGAPFFCPEETIYPAGTTIEAEASKLTLDNSPSQTITCGKTTWSGKTQAQTGEPLQLGPVSFKAEGCKSSLWGKCTLTPSSAPVGATFGYVSELVAASFYLGMKVSCGGWFNCAFSSFQPTMMGQLISGATPVVKVYGYRVSTVGCWTEAEYLVSADFTITTPQPLYAIET